MFEAAEFIPIQLSSLLNLIIFIISQDGFGKLAPQRAQKGKQIKTTVTLATSLTATLNTDRPHYQPTLLVEAEASHLTFHVHNICYKSGSVSLKSNSLPDEKNNLLEFYKKGSKIFYLLLLLSRQIHLYIF